MSTLTTRQWAILENNCIHDTLTEQLDENMSTSDDEQDSLFIGCDITTIHEEYRILAEQGLVEITHDVNSQYINLTEKGIRLKFSV